MNTTTLSPEIELEILDLVCEGWGLEDISTHLNIPLDVVSSNNVDG